MGSSHFLVKVSRKVNKFFPFFVTYKKWVIFPNFKENRGSILGKAEVAMEDWFKVEVFVEEN